MNPMSDDLAKKLADFKKTCNVDIRPFNSVRYICPRCGRKQRFPVSPRDKKGQRQTSEQTLKDGTKLVVTETEKQVHCPCGLVTKKERRGFHGK